jgi:drug/metabolite transporter (DMT)-like permease
LLVSTGLQRFKADFSLLMVSLIWGLTFVTVKNAIADMAPFTFIAIRFAIAFAFMSLFCCKKLLKLRGRDWVPGILVGILLFAGYSFQTLGLQYTTASNAGFITGLSVVMVPIFCSIASRQLPSPLVFAGALLAGVGIGFLCLSEGYTYNYGDILVLVCAVSFTFHIIFVGRYASAVDVTVLASIQIGVVAVCSGIAAIVLETHIPVHFTRDVWIGLITTAIPATSLAFLVQTYSQKYTTPMHTAIILSTEPVFSGIFGYLLLGEMLGSRGLWGAALVLAGMVLSEVMEMQTEKTSCVDAACDGS